MDEQSAKEIIRCSIRNMALLNQLVADLQGKLSNEEFIYQRRLIGVIMGSITTEMINPVVVVFPNLNISDAEQWRAAGALDETTWLKNATK